MIHQTTSIHIVRLALWHLEFLIESFAITDPNLGRQGTRSSVQICRPVGTCICGSETSEYSKANKTKPMTECTVPNEIQMFDYVPLTTTA